MEKRDVVISLAYVLVITVSIFIMVNHEGGLTGFAVFEGECADIISEEGYWELNNSILLCDDTTGITIDSSNVVFDCSGNSITADESQNLSGTIGLALTPDLTNVTVQNCDISGFDYAIYVNSGTILDVIDTSVSALESCVVGNWTDVSGNSGCLDIVGPDITVANQTVYTNESFSYQVTATDVSGIDSYSLDDGQNGSVFSIDSSGLVTNITTMEIGNYNLTVTVIDTNNQSSNAVFNVEVLEGTSPVAVSECATGCDPDYVGDGSCDSACNVAECNYDNGDCEDVTEEDSQDEEESDDSDSVSESAGAGANSESETQVPMVNCDDAWTCNDWSECINGTRTRECTKVKTNCVVDEPVTEEECTPPCTENWECSWSECVDGERTVIECTDLNACGTETNKPTTEACIPEETPKTIGSIMTGAVSVITGGATGLFEAENRVILIVVIVVIVALIAATIILARRKWKIKKALGGKTKVPVKKSAVHKELEHVYGENK